MTNATCKLDLRTLVENTSEELEDNEITEPAHFGDFNRVQ